MLLRPSALALALAVGAAVAPAQALTVPGTANPKLAGMPDGTTASAGDVAPAESPVLYALGSPLIVGLSFTVTGAVNFVPTPPAAGQGPDGNLPVVADNAAENGISGQRLPASSLLGVFLDASQPDGSAAPARLDFFSDPATRDFLTLSPLLKQVFFIGDGRTSGGDIQVINVPTGATRLFLGTGDGFGWFNNVGSFEVTVLPIISDPFGVPAPGALALFGAGLLGVIATRRRRAPVA